MKIAIGGDISITKRSWELFDKADEKGAFDDTCTEVILKVRKKVETQGNPKMPFQRIISEPIHHSQRILDREDDLFGYISIHVKDYMRMKPILLKWGCDIHVESPEILRHVMEGEVRRMAEMYGIAVTAPESQE